MRETLEIDKHISPISVHTCDLDITFEIPDQKILVTSFGFFVMILTLHKAWREADHIQAHAWAGSYPPAQLHSSPLHAGV